MEWRKFLQRLVQKLQKLDDTNGVILELMQTEQSLQKWKLRQWKVNDKVDWSKEGHHKSNTVIYGTEVRGIKEHFDR